MAETFAREARYLDPAQANNGIRASARESGGKVYVVKGTIALASQPNGDTVVLGKLPVGRSFLYGVIAADRTLGGANVKIGPRSSDDAFRAAATFTTANTPTLFGMSATAAGEGFGVGGAPTKAEEDILLTVSGGTLPAAGVLTVALYFTGP